MVDSTLLKQLGVTELEDPLIFVVSSLCGGTGAGMFLDMGYMLTSLWKRKWSRFNTKVCGPARAAQRLRRHHAGHRAHPVATPTRRSRSSTTS